MKSACHSIERVENPMRKEPIEAVIFDCDGTLVDSESLSISVLLELAAEFGPSLDYQDALRRFAGSDLAVVFRTIEKQMGRSLPDDFLQRFRERQIPVLKDRLQATEGAEELLESITLPSCVASNAPLRKIHVCLETTGLRRFFTKDRIFSAYEIQIWKPSPDLFLQAARSLHVDPERCAVIEDSGFGIEAGLAAGMQVFAFDPHNIHAHFAQVTTVQSLTELKPTLCD